MGYYSVKLEIPLRLDNHGGDKQDRDKQAAENLKADIENLIAEYEDYKRIATLGVWGP